MNVIKDIEIVEREKMIQLLEEVEKIVQLKPDLAYDKAKTALEIAHKLGDNYYALKIKGSIANIRNTMGDSKQALKMLREVLDAVRLHFPNERVFIGNLYSAIGVTYQSMGNKELALDYLLRALQVDKKNYTIQINIAAVYRSMGEREKAIEIWKQSLKLIPDKQLMVKFPVLGNTAITYINLGKIQKAKRMLYELLHETQAQPDKKKYLIYTLQAMIGLIRAYNTEGNTEKTLGYIDEILHLSESGHHSQIRCVAWGIMAEVYFKNDNESIGIKATHKAIEYANKYNYPSLKIVWLNAVIDYYEQKKQLQKAYPYLKQLHQISEKQLTESRDNNLNQIIADREKEVQLLEEKNHEIQEQNAILHQFAYIISHDLREPIRGITSFASMLNRKYAESLDQTANEYLHFILSEANLMNRNLARLLKYTTIKRNTDKIKEIDIRKIIYQIEYQYQNQPLELNISYQGASLKMQPEHAELLLTELIGNAIQFKKENEECKIEIKNQLKEGYYHLSVKDYGTGIDAAYHDKIFKVFNKINKLKGSGAGVGLAICERIAQLYKGKISVESTPDQSTTFYIKLTA